MEIYSTLTVVTPADSQDLTTLETVKRDLGITDEDEVRDVRLTDYIQQASGACADYCGRTFGEETVSETFRWRRRPRVSNLRWPLLRLERRPIVSVTSVVEDDVTLDPATDYEIDARRGWLRRLNADREAFWCGEKTVVVYVAGYAVLDSLPFGVERACIELIKSYWFSADQDPSLSRQHIDVPGVENIDQAWNSGATALPLRVTELLDPHRHLSL